MERKKNAPLLGNIAEAVALGSIVVTMIRFMVIFPELLAGAAAAVGVLWVSISLLRWFWDHPLL
jgi:hypothetical protein